MQPTPSGGAFAALSAYETHVNVTDVADRLARIISADPQAIAVDTRDGRLTIDLTRALHQFASSLRKAQIDFIEGGLTDKELPTELGASIGADRLASSHAILALQQQVRDQLLAYNLAHQLTGAIAPQAQAFFNANAPIPNFTALLPSTARIVEAHYRGSAKPIAKTLSINERIEDQDWRRAIIAGVENVYRSAQGANGPAYTPAQIDKALSRLKADARGEIAQLLQFLEDIALPRARLQVATHLMKKIANLAGPPFSTYVARLEALRRFAAGPDRPTVMIDASRAYGDAGQIDLSYLLRTTSFYEYLPIWLDPNAQMFENRLGAELAADREISYRLRANGKQYASASAKTSYELTLESLQRLLSDERHHVAPSYRLGEAIAAAVILDLTLSPTPSKSADFELELLLVEIANDPSAALHSLTDRLAKHHRLLVQMTTSVIDALKTQKLENAFRSAPISITMSLDRSILAPRSLSEETYFFRRTNRDLKRVHWLDYLVATEDALPPSRSLFSFSVSYRLSQWTIDQKAEPVSRQFQRDFSHPLLPIRFAPYANGVCSLPDPGLLRAGAGLDIAYHDDLLDPASSAFTAGRGAPRHYAQGFVALCLLHEIVLREIVRQASLEHPDLAILLIRLHAEKRSGASNALYALTQALERTLGDIAPTNLQGFVYDPNSGYASFGTRFAQTLAAATAKLPIALTDQRIAESDAEPPTRVALIAYATRPCGERQTLILAKSYTLTPGEAGSPLISYRGSIARVFGEHDAKSASDPLFDEITRLTAAGFRHIVLLSHDHMNPRRARAALEHAPHAQSMLFDRLDQSPGDLCLYTLRRDIFPAIRLRPRKSDESLFIITEAAEHDPLKVALGANVLRSLIPIFSAATFYVPPFAPGSDELRPHSGVCCYFFDAATTSSLTDRREIARQNIFGFGQGPHTAIRRSIIDLLLSLHFLESEKPAGDHKTADKTILLPVLDPFDWVSPATIRSFGELEIPTSRRKTLRINVTALLSNVANILNSRPSP